MSADNTLNKAITTLQDNGIVVGLTDTIFGILGKASSKQVVSRIYALKERDLDKPFIVLISTIEDLKQFGVTDYKMYEQYFKPKTSIILPVPSDRWEYLHRGTKSIAFRLVGKKYKNLYTLIGSVGPLVAPSANPQGIPPGRTMAEARKYFGDRVDLYIPGFRKEGKPSTIISFVSGSPVILRK
jgi:L-threonylcarbamoyladenylate synthase